MRARPADSNRYANLNRALLFAGLCVEEDGRLVAAERAATLSDAACRAKELTSDLQTRGVHLDVLHFCRDELLVETDEPHERS
jgi:hypothetical protein